MKISKYQMLAQDSVSLALRSWLVDVPDFRGEEYPSVSGSIALDPAVSDGGIIIPEAFDPTTIVTSHNLKCWYYTPRGVTIVSGGCSVLADLSGQGQDLPFLTGKPVVNTVDASIDGLQTLTLGNNQSLYKGSGFALTPPFTMGLIVKPTGWHSTNVLFGNNGGNGLAQASSSPRIYQNNTVYSNFENAVAGTWYFILAEFLHSTDDNIQIGNQDPTSVPGTDSGNATWGSLGFNLLGGAGAGGFDLLEGFIYDGQLTSDEKANLGSYAASHSASIQT